MTKTIFDAVYDGNLREVRNFIEQGFDLGSVRSVQDHDTALAYAIRRGQLSIAKFLVEMGADIEQTNAVVTATIRNYHEMLEFVLFQTGASCSNLPLWPAIRSSNTRILTLLVHTGCMKATDYDFVRISLKRRTDIEDIAKHEYKKRLVCKEL